MDALEELSRQLFLETVDLQATKVTPRYDTYISLVAPLKKVAFKNKIDLKMCTFSYFVAVCENVGVS